MQIFDKCIRDQAKSLRMQIKVGNFEIAKCDFRSYYPGHKNENRILQVHSYRIYDLLIRNKELFGRISNYFPR